MYQEVKTFADSFRLRRWRQQVNIYCNILSFVLKTVESRKHTEILKNGEKFVG